MKIKRLVFVAIIALLALLLTTQIVSAHQTVTIGNYDVEYGWINEPAVIDQANAIVINITDNTGTAADANIDASSLLVQAVFGDQAKTLTLQPLGEDAPGQFIAPITPTRPGVYTVHLGGSIGSTSFNDDVQPEEVNTLDLVQFPPIVPLAGASPTSSIAFWFAIAGLILGAAGTGIGIYSLNRKPPRG